MHSLHAQGCCAKQISGATATSASKVRVLRSALRVKRACPNLSSFCSAAAGHARSYSLPSPLWAWANQLTSGDPPDALPLLSLTSEHTMQNLPPTKFPAKRSMINMHKIAQARGPLSSWALSSISSSASVLTRAQSALSSHCTAVYFALRLTFQNPGSLRRLC